MSPRQLCGGSRRPQRPRQGGSPPTGATGPTSDRRGFTLLLAVLVLLALATLGTGLLFVSTQEARVARALVHASRARVGAESAARAALLTWRTSVYRDLAPGDRRAAVITAGALGHDVAYAVEVERLRGGLFLIRAHARSGPPLARGARASVGLLARGLLPAEFAPDLAAALSAAGPVELLAGATLDGTALAGRPPGWTPADCPPDSVLGSPAGPRPGVRLPHPVLLLAAASSSVQGTPPLDLASELADSAAFAGLGPLGLPDLARLADRVETGAVTAAPRLAAGACDTAAPGNWGDPADPASPCGAYLPLILAPAGLDLTGAGQGVLVVRGDLSLAPGASFTGAVLATGRLSLAAGASITGAARAREASIAGTLRFDTCALARALAGTRGLDRPLRPAARSWLPIF